MRSLPKFFSRYQPICRTAAFALVAGTLWGSPLLAQESAPTATKAPAPVSEPQVMTLMKCGVINDATVFGMGEAMILAHCHVPLVPITEEGEQPPAITLESIPCLVRVAHVSPGELPLSPQPAPEPQPTPEPPTPAKQ